MLHGSQTIGLNWRGFRYATWAELAAVAVFVGLFLVDGQLSRGFEFGVVGVIAYLICNWANPIPTFHAFLVVATAVLNAAGWTVPALARYNSCLHLLSRENRRGCTLHQRLRTQVGSCAVPPKCSYEIVQGTVDRRLFLDATSPIGSLFRFTKAQKWRPARQVGGPQPLWAMRHYVSRLSTPRRYRQ